MKAKCWPLLLAGIMAGSAASQTMIDLRTQSRGVDHTEAQSTKPFKAGTSLPSVCSVGEFFYLTAGQPGKNLYSCVATNVWLVYSGATLPTASQPGILSTDGNSPYWTEFSGDVSGSANALQVRGLQGRAVSAAVPANGQTLVWRSTSSQWEPSDATSAGAIGAMSDVLIQTPWTNHLLFFDAVDSKWKNKGLVGGASGAIEVNAGLTPVEVELNAEAAKQYLSTETPAANAIPRADASGKLDPAWLPSVAGVLEAHAASHQNGGSDEVGTATPSPYAIPKADAAGKLDAGWLPSQPSHAASHQNGGSDEVGTATPTAHAIPKADAAGKLSSGWLPTVPVSAGGTGGTTFLEAVAALLNPRSLLLVREEFIAGTVGLGTIGETGWIVTNTGGITKLAGEVGREGIYRATITNASRTFYLGVTTSSGLPLTGLNTGIWRVSFGLRVANPAANIGCAAGLLASGPAGTAVAVDGYYFRLNTATSSWEGVTRAGAVENPVKPAAAASAATWYDLEIRGENGNITFWVNGAQIGAPVAAPATANLSPMFYFMNGSTTQPEDMDIDSFMLVRQR